MYIQCTCSLVRVHYTYISKQKLQERSASLRKVKFADARDREKWEKVMTVEFISSEDNGYDEGNEVLIVRPLPWRSARVDQMFNNLDRVFVTNLLLLSVK